MIKQAIFLVGGKGTRLGHLTQTVPKPLLEIAPNIRFLDVVIGEAARQGFTDIVLLAGHLGDQVEAIYHGRRFHGAQVRVIREPEPMGTGGALAFARDQLDPWFVMGNGDSLFEMNLRALAADRRAGLVAKLALREVPDPGRYGAVSLAGNQIDGFFEKSTQLKGPMPINGGVYVMSRDILEFISGPCSIEQDVFPKLAAQGTLDGTIFEGYFLDIGLPDTYAQACAEVAARQVRPIAFLDRDGVLNHDSGYTHHVADLKWMPNAKEAVRMLNDAGYYTLVVTNQAGVARGLYSEADVDLFHQAMRQELAQVGAYIDGFYACPYHPEAVIDAYRSPNHSHRKPNPGMLLDGFHDWPHDKVRSFMIGDRDSDVAAGQAAGIAAFHFDGHDLMATIASAIDATDQSVGPS
jgi:histidinol-phosphate phosphatase family protein